MKEFGIDGYTGHEGTVVVDDAVRDASGANALAEDLATSAAAEFQAAELQATTAKFVERLARAAVLPCWDCYILSIFADRAAGPGANIFEYICRRPPTPPRLYFEYICGGEAAGSLGAPPAR